MPAVSSAVRNARISQLGAQTTEQNKKITAVRFAKKLMFPLVLLVIISIGMYHVIDKVLLDSNIELMKELAEHDKRVIGISFDVQWNSLESIAYALDMLDSSTDEEVISCLQVIDRAYADTATMLLTSDGLCYRSDGLILKDPDINDAVDGQSGRFVILYHPINDEAVGLHNEYLLVGVSLDGVHKVGRDFTYALRSISIDVMDPEFKTDCFEGRGQCSVINGDGSYAISSKSSGNIAGRSNFFKMLSSARIRNYGTVERLCEELNSSDGGVTFAMAQEGQQYIIHLVKLEPTDWYYVSQVPRSVFSTLTRFIFSFVTGLDMLMFACILILVFRHTKAAERRMKERELHHRQISDALKIAQNASSAKTDFLNSMSHDIRTPMNSIIGFTILAQKNLDNKELVRDYLNNISLSSDHLMSLINDILCMSRIDSGQVKLSETNEELGEMIHAVINMIMPQVISRELNLFVDTNNITAEHIVCDRLKIMRGLLNIMSNAVKYTMPGGSIHCYISQEETDSSGKSWFEFRICDTGIGMSSEFISKVFDIFTREQTSTVSRIQGTGLGLTISKSYFEMMGGTISCTSVKSKGTEFTVRIPVKVRNEQEDDPEGFGRHKTALVADSNEANCRILAGMLEKQGIRCDITFSYKEAVDMTGEAFLCGEAYDIYFVGWDKPGIDGVEAARSIRREAGRDCRIVLVSVYDLSCTEIGSEGLDIAGHMSKPVFPSDVRKVLESLFSEKPVSGKETSYALDGVRVLLAEDNEGNQLIARSLLNDQGVETDIARNGREACEMLLQKGAGYYDAVLMDIQMPVMDGYEATYRIRHIKDNGLSAIPIIAMTANAYEEDREAAGSVGMDSYISKPIDPQKLYKEIALAVEKNGMKAALKDIIERPV